MLRNETNKLNQGWWRYILILLVIIAGVGIMRLYENELIPEIENKVIDWDDAIVENEEARKKSNNPKEVCRLEIENKVYEYCREKNIILDQSYIGVGAYEVMDLFVMEDNVYSIEEIKKGKQLGKDILRALEKRDFEDYIQRHKEAVSLLKTYSNEEKKLEEMKCNFWVTFDRTGKYNYFSSCLVSYYYALNKSLQEGKNFCYLNDYSCELTKKEKMIFQNRVDILDYMAVNGYLGIEQRERTCIYSANSNLKNMYYAGNMIVLFFLIYLAATTFGGEIEKGTIKNILISPKSRRDILLKKIVSLFVFSLILHMIVYFIISIIGCVFMKDKLLPQFYITESGVKTISVYLAFFIGQIVQSIEVMIWVLGTVTISLLFRNRTVAAITSSVVYLLNEYFIGLLEKKESLLKYFLFSYYGNINQRLFDVGNFEVDYLLGTNTVSTKNSIYLCIGVVLILGAVLYYASNMILQKTDY